MAGGIARSADWQFKGGIFAYVGISGAFRNHDLRNAHSLKQHALDASAGDAWRLKSDEGT